jgi:hypothetical protein
VPATGSEFKHRASLWCLGGVDEQDSASFSVGEIGACKDTEKTSGRDSESHRLATIFDISRDNITYYWRQMLR